MTSRELIAAEANNVDRIALYREGLFWKAYERSAYALCTQVRPFKPTRKVLKALAGGDIVSVGFPAIAADRILAGLERLDLSSDAAAAVPAAAAGSAASAALAAVGSDVAAAAGSAAEGSAAVCASPAVAPTSDSATRMLLAAPQPIVEGEFLAWKSALPISLSIPRPSAADASCEDSAVGELPLSGYASGDASLCGVPADALRPAAGRAVSSVLAGSDGLAAVAGGVDFAPRTSRPQLWSRLGGWLVRLAAGGGSSPRDVADTADAVAPVRDAGALFAAGSAADAADSAASAERVLDALRKFEVADKTPMECMMFIAELKKQIL